MNYANDKRIVNGPTCNQLYPFKYEWAWKSYKSAKKNHWMPDEISMAKDVLQFHTQLDPVQTHVYTNVLAYLSTADIMALRNVSLAVMEKVTAPEVQAYLATQAAEEAVHSHAYQYCLETLGLDGDDIYNRYRTVPAIAQKIEAANTRINAMLRPGLDLTNRDDLEEFMMGYAFFAAVFEGVWFYNGFSPLFAIARSGLMTGTAEQLQFILRDEALHFAFGIKCVNTISEEENIQLDPKALKDMFLEAEAIERTYIEYILKDPLRGYALEDHMEQSRFLMNRRARALRTAAPFEGAKPALPWLDEMAGGTRKEKNFFETRVTEYQTGGLGDYETTSAAKIEDEWQLTKKSVA